MIASLPVPQCGVSFFSRSKSRYADWWFWSWMGAEFSCWSVSVLKRSAEACFVREEN